MNKKSSQSKAKASLLWGSFSRNSLTQFLERSLHYKALWKSERRKEVAEQTNNEFQEIFTKIFGF